MDKLTGWIPSLSPAAGLLGVAGGAISALFGGWSAGMTTLVIFMLVDYAMGFIVAAVFHKSGKSESGRLDSGAGWKGLFKKGVTLLIVLVTAQLDQVIGTDFIRDAVVIAYIANEAVSIAENAGLMGVPIPPVARRAIEILNKKSEGGGKE